MRLKITKNLTYLEARKQLEQKPEFSFSHIVKSLAAKPETKQLLHNTVSKTVRLQRVQKFSLRGNQTETIFLKIRT